MTIAESTVERAARLVDASGLDRVAVAAAGLVNAMEADMDLRRLLGRERHRHVREKLAALYSELEEAGR